MRKTFSLNFSLVILCGLFMFSSCVKRQSQEDLIEQNCKLIDGTKLLSAPTLYYVGDSLHLEVNQKADIALYVWTLLPNPTDRGGGWVYFDNYLEKSEEGTYQLQVIWEDCAVRTDTFSIRVINRPVPPPCTPEKNSAAFTSLPDPDPLSVTTFSEPLTGRRQIRGYYERYYPDIRITFHSYWNSREPEDGEYRLGGLPVLDEKEPYTMYITSLSDGITYSSDGGKAYVTHENGKLTVTFCSISFTGSNGSYTFQTEATASLTTP